MPPTGRIWSHAETVSAQSVTDAQPYAFLAACRTARHGRGSIQRTGWMRDSEHRTPQTRLAAYELFLSIHFVRPRRTTRSAKTMKARSPIEMMIDAACGISDEPPPLRAPNDEEKEAARDVAAHVIQHIDDMYPKMWEGMPKTARVSVRNTIYNRVASLLAQWSNVSDQEREHKTL